MIAAVKYHKVHDFKFIYVVIILIGVIFMSSAKLKYGSEEANLLETIRRVVKKEIANAVKEIQNGKMPSYSSIMENTKNKIDPDDIYSSIPSFTNSEVFSNKYSYQKMKNKINYGISTDSKTFVNKASSKKLE